MANLTDWLEVTREDGVRGRRINTMPILETCWYYLRYINPHNTEKLPTRTSQTMVANDIHVGGRTRCSSPVLARFWHKFHDLVVPTKELIPKLSLNQGMILGTSYRDSPWEPSCATDKAENVMVPFHVENRRRAPSKHQLRCSKLLKNVIQTMWWNNMGADTAFAKCSWDRFYCLV